LEKFSDVTREGTSLIYPVSINIAAVLSFEFSPVLIPFIFLCKIFLFLEVLWFTDVSHIFTFLHEKVYIFILLELFFARRLFTLLCLLKVQILALWALNYSITPLSLVLGFVGEELFVKRLKLGVLGVEKCWVDSFFDLFVVLVVQNDRVNLLSGNISTELLQLFLDVVLIYIGHSLENFNMFVLITTLEVIMMLCVAVEAETYFPAASFTLKPDVWDRIDSTALALEANMLDLVFEVFFVLRKISKLFTFNVLVHHFLKESTLGLHEL
jgi:hypothetical protein